MKTKGLKTALTGIAISFLPAAPIVAQEQWNDYAKQSGRVLYQGQSLPDADATTFQELGFGYGKDAYNVYYRGEVLEFVNPGTFQVDAKYTRHHKIGNKSATDAAATAVSPMHSERTATEGKGKRKSNLLADLGMGTTVSADYEVRNGSVYYEGNKVENADAATFSALKAGYAKDKRHAYYMGRVISGALGGVHFEYISDDYATDQFHTYFKGKEVNRD